MQKGKGLLFEIYPRTQDIIQCMTPWSNNTEKLFMGMAMEDERCTGHIGQDIISAFHGNTMDIFVMSLSKVQNFCDILESLAVALMEREDQQMNIILSIQANSKPEEASDRDRAQTALDSILSFIPNISHTLIFFDAPNWVADGRNYLAQKLPSSSCVIVERPSEMTQVQWENCIKMFVSHSHHGIGYLSSYLKYVCAGKQFGFPSCVSYPQDLYFMSLHSFICKKGKKKICKKTCESFCPLLQ